jgi:subtilisin
MTGTIVADPHLTWHLFGRDVADYAVASPIDDRITADWAWSGASGAGVRVCVIDSGIEDGHPLVGPVENWYAVTGGTVQETEPGDAFGHGTACASIIRRIAPECELTSVRVLGGAGSGTGATLLAALRWSVRRRFHVVNLSLSTTRPQFDRELRQLADEAHFQGTALITSAHNSPVESYPWRYSSVISVGSHAEDAPDLVIANTRPPADFFAPGWAVTVAGLGGGTTRNTGNSFATPHVTGRCALILGKHPDLTVSQLKTILYVTSNNVRGAP